MQCRGSVAFVALITTVPLFTASAQIPSRAALAEKLAPCQVPGLSAAALCGHFEVPENRASSHARQISLNVVLLPATTASVAPDPLVFLAGGGVVSATRYAGFLTRAFASLRRGRDVLLVDQRGTWGSNPLVCRPPSPAASEAPGGSVAVATMLRCRDSLSTRADLRAYTTLNAVADLEEVRAWLGYERVNLYGVSYGTKVAQVYLRMHPERVCAAVMYGVVPVSVATQLDLARSAQASIQRVFQLCLADSTCATAFPNVAAEFDSLLRRLSITAERISLARPDGSTQLVTVTDRAVRDLVQGMLGSARSVERLPLLIHLAFAGNAEPMARAIAGEGPPAPPGPPRGVFLSLLCSESISQVRSSDVARATDETFFGDLPVRAQLRLCADWPRASLPVDFWQPVKTDVPVLAISGDLDPITPPSYADVVTRTMSNATHIVVENRSHNDVDPCITSLFEQFLMAGDATRLERGCVSRPATLRFQVRFAAPPAQEPLVSCR